jgi:RNA polymerase sigma-70 factor (ECF subfamily)
MRTASQFRFLTSSPRTKLAEVDREVLLLRNYEGLSNLEAAQLLGLQAAAASQRYGRALLRLRKLLLEHGLPEEHS